MCVCVCVCVCWGDDKSLCVVKGGNKEKFLNTLEIDTLLPKTRINNLLTLSEN